VQTVKPRLRFDKVARRFVSHLRTALRDAVPDGTIVTFTITAPIRLASKTAVALEAHIRELLARRAKQAESEQTIHGNQIRVRVVRTGSTRPAQVVGYVHTPDPSAADALLTLH
jgi:hypothetical protein